jgi:hypothetical protein
LRRRSHYHGCHHPRKRVIQYSRDAGNQSKGRGVLDTPLFAGYDEWSNRQEQRKAPYSAGLAAGGAPDVEDRAAAAFFSTMRTAMIEPS